MPVTQLANVVVPEVFEEYVALDTCASTALKDSGVLVTNPFMQEQLALGGNILQIPAWNVIADFRSHKNEISLGPLFHWTNPVDIPRIAAE